MASKSDGYLDLSLDELLDTLVLNQPRTKEGLREELAKLCRGAEDADLILHSFRDNELLRIGVCDILGKATLSATTGALSDLAETILSQIADLELPRLAQRFGLPHLTDGPRHGQESRWVLLGLGKLGQSGCGEHLELGRAKRFRGTANPRDGPLEARRITIQPLVPA